MAEDNADMLAIKNTGFVSSYDIPKYFHQYINVDSINDCLSGENYFLYLLAILDKRTGKRKIKKIYENIESEPQWIRKFIILRAEGEGL